MHYCVNDNFKQLYDTKQFNRLLNASAPSLKTSLPYHTSLIKPLKKILASHDLKWLTQSEPVEPTLRDLLTKTTPPTHLTPTSSATFHATTYSATYDVQTYRPVYKRISELGVQKWIPSWRPDWSYYHQVIPCYHSRTTGHIIEWTDLTTIKSAPATTLGQQDTS